MMLFQKFILMTSSIYLMPGLQLFEEASYQPPLVPSFPLLPFLFPLCVSPSTPLSPPPLSFFLSVFFSRDFQFLNTKLFLPTGPPPHTHTEREAQVSLRLRAWICDFLFEYSSIFLGLPSVTTRL